MTTTTAEIPSETWTNDEWMIPYLFFLLILGTIGNSFGIIVFLNSSMRKYSCSLYFLLMLIFDEFTLLIWIINRLFGEYTSVLFRNRSTFLCKLFVVIYYNSAQSAVGMLVLATFDRVYTTIHIARGHFNVRLYSLRRRFQYICLGSFFSIIVGLNALLFGSQLINLPEIDEKFFCIIINLKINRIYSIIDLCVYTIIPFLCMFIGDILIVWYIRKTRARVIRLNDINKRRERHLSITLVITTVVSLLIVSPYSFFNLLNNVSTIAENNYETWYTLNDIFGLLSMCTHGMHFYLFLIISSTIRKHCKMLLNSLFQTCWHRRDSVRPAIIPNIKTMAIPLPAINTSQRTTSRQTT